MHLWPSMRIRDSFKLAYLKKLEWNLHRMNSEKQSQSNQENLLDHKDGVVDGKVSESPNSRTLSAAVLLCREILMVLSCCYCCFCCGACVDQEDG